jgi:hypothetical protein
VNNILFYGEARDIFPYGIVTDFAWGFINSIQLVFNRLTIDEYIEICFKYLIEKNKDALPKIFVRSYLCCIHFLHNIIKKTRTFSNDEVVVKSLNLFFTVIQTSKHIDEFEKNYGHVINICYSEFKTPTFEQSFEYINNILKQNESSNIDEYEDSDSDDYLSMTDSSEELDLKSEKSQKRKKVKLSSNAVACRQNEKTIKERSRFHKYFEDFYNVKTTLIDTNNFDDNLQANEFYNMMMMIIVYF